MSITDLIDRQLAFYNAHDLAGFCSTYADEVVIRELPAGHEVLTGQAALRQRYALSLADPLRHASIISRTSFGEYVLDLELVTTSEREPFTAGVLYRVQDGLIREVWLLR